MVAYGVRLHNGDSQRTGSKKKIMKILIENKDRKILEEIDNPTSSQVLCYLISDSISIDDKEYMSFRSNFDHNKQTLKIIILE